MKEAAPCQRKRRSTRRDADRVDTILRAAYRLHRWDRLTKRAFRATDGARIKLTALETPDTSIGHGRETSVKVSLPAPDARQWNAVGGPEKKPYAA